MNMEKNLAFFPTMASLVSRVELLEDLIADHL